MLHFQGICKYDMASPKMEYAGLPYFRVLTKNEERNDNNVVSYIRYTEIHVFGSVIRLDRNKEVYVSITMAKSYHHYTIFWQIPKIHFVREL